MMHRIKDGLIIMLAILLSLSSSIPAFAQTKEVFQGEKEAKIEYIDDILFQERDERVGIQDGNMELADMQHWMIVGQGQKVMPVEEENQYMQLETIGEGDAREGSQLVQMEIPIQAGARYQVTFRYQASEGSMVRMIPYIPEQEGEDGFAGPLEGSDQLLDAAADWQMYQREIDIPQDIQQNQMNLIFVLDSDQQPGLLLLDDILFEFIE